MLGNGLSRCAGRVRRHRPVPKFGHKITASVSVKGAFRNMAVRRFRAVTILGAAGAFLLAAQPAPVQAEALQDSHVLSTFGAYISTRPTSSTSTTSTRTRPRAARSGSERFGTYDSLNQYYRQGQRAGQHRADLRIPVRGRPRRTAGQLRHDRGNRIAPGRLFVGHLQTAQGSRNGTTASRSHRKTSSTAS